MALVTLRFVDNDDGEQVITYDSSRGLSFDAASMELTPAEELAATALRLLSDYLKAEGAEVIIQKPEGASVN